MRRLLPVGMLVAVVGLLFRAGAVHAHGLLIPVEKTVPPLAMLNHFVAIDIQDQVAVTRVEQTFRNHTDRDLEATYVFPVPKGAGVQKFTMWVSGKETAGELLKADEASKAYTEIVRRTQDPGLLEYLGNNMMRLRIFPVPKHADQKVAISFTSVAPRDSNVVEYIYPLKTNGKATTTLEKFSLKATIKSQHAIQNIYSPTHALSVVRPSDHEAVVTFERDQAPLDKDFQIFYAVRTDKNKDFGLTILTHRPISAEPGYVLLLLSPRVEMPNDQQVPRDMVFVLDTSGSMRGPKMDQAKKALKYCLENLSSGDRFGVIHFATAVNKYRDGLIDTSKEQIAEARKWVDNLEPTGGTAINDALATALAMRTGDMGRTFTVVFFTDGLPTIGETNPDKIMKNVAGKNSSNTRIFTFGVGDDVNATMLDQLADGSRAISTYVRPEEDIEAKVSGLYGKISRPVLADVKLSLGQNVTLQEMYPPQLPDLFYGGQVIVLARYSGQGHIAVKLNGTVGMETKEYVYETDFPAKVAEDRAFVEHLWARRKVGYLLDQIRLNGEKKELIDEVVTLAKRYSIVTPYTSHLIVPDAPVPVAAARASGKDGKPDVAFHLQTPQGLGGPGAGGKPAKVSDFAKRNQSKPGELESNRGRWTEDELRRNADDKSKGKEEQKQLKEALEKKTAYDQANRELGQGNKGGVQSGKLGVDLSVQMSNLRTQSRMEQTAQRNVAGRNCMEVGGVWIDDKFDAKMPLVTVKAQSDAYFRILELHPTIKEVYQLGNHLVWVTPNGTALVIDMNDGKEKLDDKEIERLFVAKK